MQPNIKHLGGDIFAALDKLQRYQTADRVKLLISISLLINKIKSISNQIIIIAENTTLFIGHKLFIKHTLNGVHSVELILVEETKDLRQKLALLMAYKVDNNLVPLVSVLCA